MSEERKKRLFALILLCVAFTINVTAKSLGYFTISGLSVLFGFAVIIAWTVDFIKDNRKNKRN
ncbi:hypothetical protein [Bacillus cereus]|uniref:hypothetical protein n=1 Tax=Bacillus cereus TaxID=1396 RepID=UPI00080F5DB1|nr:hypothetical protein [Bacillus cereus]ANV74138.1 hypothetical protein BCM43_27105 [Bacillus thuringiensis]